MLRNSLKSLLTIAGLAVLATLATGSTASADNWPSWRGVENNGICYEKGLPVQWSADSNVAWKLALPGSGGATPVIWGERIFLTAAVDNQLVLMCIGTDGQERWRRTVSHGNKNVRGDEGNSAANSPSTDGKHVWSMFANGAMACFTVDGQKVWQIDLQERYGKFEIAFGMTSTPVLDDGRLYVQMIHGKRNSEPSRGIVACIDAATGEGIWKHIRATDGVQENKHSYASPVMYDDGENKFLLTHGADYVIAHDISDGSELWRCGDLNVKSNYDNTLRFVSSPACADGIIVVPTAKRGPKCSGRNEALRIRPEFDLLHHLVDCSGKEGIGHHTFTRHAFNRGGDIGFRQPVLNDLVSVVLQIADKPGVHSGCEIWMWRKGPCPASAIRATQG